MISDEFGILHLSGVAPETAVQQVGWSGCSVNIIALLIAIFLFLLNFGTFLNIVPEVLSCLFRARPNLGLEHNLHSASERNATAWVLLTAFILIADRYRLYNPSFLSWLPFGWSLLTTTLFMLVLFASRYLFYLFRPRDLRGDVSKAAHNVPYTCFIGLVLVVAPTACITLLAHTPDNIARSIILYETAFFFLLSVIRTTQFLAKQCSAFSTFLYLCALELIPAAAVIASARYL